MLSNIAQANISQTIFVDIQTRLAAAMAQDALGQAELAKVIKNCAVLAESSLLLNVPIILTEQYAKGLGETVPEISALLPAIKPIEKITFSAMATPAFSRQLTRDRSQIILAGMETHICILQTAMSLIAAGKQVFVVEDAMMSRNPANKVNAIARMRAAGCIISNTESIVFEWLGRADGDVFKTISKLIR